MFFKPNKEEDQKKISLMRPMLAKIKTADHQQIFMKNLIQTGLVGNLSLKIYSLSLLKNYTEYNTL